MTMNKNNLTLINLKNMSDINSIIIFAKKNRYFHSSKVNLADEELVKRVAALKSDYREEDILLNNTEIQNLKEIIKNIKNFDTNSSIDKEKWLQDVKQNISSFEEALPEYFGALEAKPSLASPVQIGAEDEDSFNGIVGFISKLSKLDNKEVSNILKDNGLINGLKILSNEPFIIEKLSEENINEHDMINVRKRIEEQEQKFNDINKDISSIKSNVTDLTDISTKIEDGLETSRKFLDLFLKNQSNLNMMIGATAIISPILAYRGLLSTYTRVMLTPLPTNISTASYDRNLKLRQRIVTRFNRLAIPVICGYYIYLQSYHKVFTTKFNLDVGNVSVSSSSIGVFNKFPNWFKLLMIPIIILSILLFIPPIVKNYSPSLYNYLQEIILRGPYWITFPILAWLVGWVLYYVLELYLYIIFTIDTKKITVPKYLPQFVINWLNRIEEDSKLTSKRWVINMYLRIILFHFILTFFFIYFFIV